MVAAGIANGGVVMKPRMVDEVVGDDLSVQKQFDSTPLGPAMTGDQAAAITAAMQASVSTGAAQGARIDGVDVAGKTGTAENGPNRPNTTWFIAFAPADAPRVAVAVVLENQSGVGGTTAAPIARDIMQAILSSAANSNS